MSTSSSTCKNTQFRPLLEFVFFVGDQLPPVDAPIEHFQYATQIFLALEDQKNAIRGETISHFRSESPAAFPVRAYVNIFPRMRKLGYPATTPVSDYPSDQGLRTVNASDIIYVLRVNTH